MKLKIFTLATFLTCAAFSVNGQTGDTNPDPNNPAPNTNSMNTQQVREVQSRAAAIPGENKIDPSAQMEFVRAENGTDVKDVKSTEVGYKTNVNPQTIVPAAKNTSNAFGVNGSGNLNNNARGSATVPFNTANENNNRAAIISSSNNGNVSAASAEPNQTVQAGNLQMAVRGNSTVVPEMVNENNGVIANTEISLIPNPAQSFTNVLLENPTREKVKIFLVDLNGTVVKNFSYAPGANSFPLDISTLRAGVYMVHIQEGNKAVSETKLTISR